MEIIKKYLKKKELIILILVLIVVLVSFSYAFFLSTDMFNNNIATTDCFKLTFIDSNDINLDKTYPMSDSEGSNLTPYQFTIKNVCNLTADYQVNIETLSVSTLDTEYIRYKLDDQNSNILGQQTQDFEYINADVKESRNIQNGKLVANEEKTYNLRLWVDENSTADQSSYKIYKGKVVIKALENRDQSITLNLNGGVLDINEIIKTSGREFGKLPKPTKDDNIFAGWYLEPEYLNLVSENTIVESGMDNIYAKWDAKIFDYSYINDYQVFTAPYSGLYKIELWGAQGGTANGAAGGLGGYTSGTVSLSQNTKLYVYVGQQGLNSSSYGQYSALGGYNGGGSTSGYQRDHTTYLTYASGGGGATDIRYFGDTTPTSSDLAWDSNSGLNSRIMVAGAGGGNGTESRFTNTPGYGGGLTAGTGTTTSSYVGGTGGNQASGGIDSKPSLNTYGYSQNGFFGKGGSNSSYGLDGAGWNGCGGGSGYYGGGAGQAFGAGGGGGSSYISGHAGSLAIASGTTNNPRTIKSGCTSSSTSVECSKHYSGLYFTDTKMIDGSGYAWSNIKGSLEAMPNPLGGFYNNGAGHLGNGYARIKYLGE